MNRRSIFNLIIPVLAYLPGSLYIIFVKNDVACSVPCFEVMIAPINQTYILTTTHFGLIGEIVLSILILLWVLNLITMAYRGI